MKSIYTTIATCLLGILVNNAHAQSDSKSVLSNMVLNDAISLTATGVDQNATFSTTSDYINGIEKTSAVHLVVDATKGFKIAVKAATANFTGSSIIPAATLSVRPSGPGDGYVPLTTSDQILFPDETQGAALAYNIDYFFTPGITHAYTAGTYTLNVTYTATLL